MTFSFIWSATIPPIRIGPWKCCPTGFRRRRKEEIPETRRTENRPRQGQSPDQPAPCARRHRRELLEWLRILCAVWTSMRRRRLGNPSMRAGSTTSAHRAASSPLTRTPSATSGSRRCRGTTAGTTRRPGSIPTLRARRPGRSPAPSRLSRTHPGTFAASGQCGRPDCPGSPSAAIREGGRRLCIRLSVRPTTTAWLHREQHPARLADRGLR